jgi:hypothetical protein
MNRKVTFSMDERRHSKYLLGRPISSGDQTDKTGLETARFYDFSTELQ